jgi:hypothetical protein
LSTKVTAPIYVNSTIFLFLGGFIIALTMEKWNLHKRIALLIIRTIGSGPSRIVLGFMVAAGFLSMWISNTATVIMMLPIGMAIISKMESEFGAEETHKLTLGLMLGIAYACSVGGMATLVGTPPNLAFARIFSITFPTAKPIAFGSWFFLALPLSAVFMVVIWSIFTKILYRVPAHVTIDRSIVEKEYKALGPMSYEERVVLVVFTLTAVLWVFRKDLVLGFVSIPGWSNLIPYPKLIDDGTVALFMAMLMFFIPTRSADADTATLIGGGACCRQNAVGHCYPFWWRFCSGQGFSNFRARHVDRPELCGYRTAAPHRHGVDHLFYDDLFDGSDIQYRHHPDDSADIGFGCGSKSTQSAASDDPGHPLGLLRLYDAHCHTAQCDRFRQRADQNCGYGQNGHYHKFNRHHYGNPFILRRADHL